MENKTETLAATGLALAAAAGAVLAWPAWTVAALAVTSGGMSLIAGLRR